MVDVPELPPEPRTLSVLVICRKCGHLLATLAETEVPYSAEIVVSVPGLVLEPDQPARPKHPGKVVVLWCRACRRHPTVKAGTLHRQYLTDPTVPALAV